MFSNTTLLSFAMDDLVAALSALDDGWLCEPQRTGMRQAAVEVMGFVTVALGSPDRAPLIKAAYVSLLAFGHALGRAIDGRRVDPVAADTCRDALAAMLDALGPFLDEATARERERHQPGGRCASGESGATNELVERSNPPPA